MGFWTYILHCRGGVFYTGHTDDLERRVSAHKSGLVPGFTQGRQPLELVWSQEFPTRYEALAAERQIKGWSRKKKLALIRGDWAEISRLARAKNGASTGSARTDLMVSRSVIAAMCEAAARAAPFEACGLLLGTDGCISEARPAANVHPEPSRHFEIDPVALIAAHRAARAGAAQIIGYYHSHPTGLARPSATDRALASGDGRVWAIVAGGEAAFWRDTREGFEPLSTRVVDG
jgi:predicted GIY-YIG superfamily endonuclease/proteasome lid subunit RPN8/RPN11